MANTNKLNSQVLRTLVKDVIFPQNELARRQAYVTDQESCLKRNIVIEFSSPNIAKPFHYGHLKSTIFGNYLANLHTHLGFNVTRLNYLGDWGTQFGLLGLQLKESQCDMSEISKMENPMSFLVQKYVEANERSKNDEEYFKKAKDHFRSIEQNHSAENPAYAQWKQIRALSMDELASSYDDLGVTFDHYEFESNYFEASKRLVDKLLVENYAFKLEDGAVMARVYDNSGQTVEVPIQKSDGSSLYLSRDLAAVFERQKQFKFDKILYVAGADQARHFNNLKQIVKQMKIFHCDETSGKRIIQDEQDQIVHVRTGKVIGMSTRSGNFLLLSDLIREAKSRYVITTKNTPTTKISTSSENNAANQAELIEVAKQLALSAIFYYDLRFKRARNYSFDWNSATSDGNESGLNLQATHARLCSLLGRADKELNLNYIDEETYLRYDAIECLGAFNLLTVMSKFDAILRDCYTNLESEPLIKYSNVLCRAINRARQSKELQVLNESNEKKARSRLSLFEKAKSQLCLIINLIGLKALDRI